MEKNNMIKRRINLMQELALFGGVNEEMLHFILKNSYCIHVPQNKLFFQEKDIADAMYILEEGHVEIFKTWQDQHYSLAELKAGDCFGEMSLVDCDRRSASIMAIDACKAIKIPSCVLTKIALHNIEQYALIQMNMGREICRRLRKADERLFHQLVEATGNPGQYH